MNLNVRRIIVGGGQQLAEPTFEATQAAPGIVNVDVFLPSGADGMFVLRLPNTYPDVWSQVATTDTISEAEQLTTVKAMAYATDAAASAVAEYVVPPFAPHTPVPDDDAIGIGTPDTGVTVSFSATNTAGSVTMDIYLRQVGAPSWVKIADGISGAATHVQGSMEFATEYEWYVVAHGGGHSVTGPTWSFTTIEAE